jgi:phosphatidylglycerol:prolipoprotein diacylglycerol transferase
MIVEQFREPDAYLGFLFASVTMGQLLSLPLVAFGLWLMVRAKPAPAPKPKKREAAPKKRKAAR